VHVVLRAVFLVAWKHACYIFGSLLRSARALYTDTFAVDIHMVYSGLSAIRARKSTPALCFYAVMFGIRYSSVAKIRCVARSAQNTCAAFEMPLSQRRRRPAEI